MADAKTTHPSPPALITRKDLEQRKVTFKIEDLLPSILPEPRQIPVSSVLSTTSSPEDPPSSRSPPLSATGKVSSSERDLSRPPNKLQDQLKKTNRSSFSPHQVHQLENVFERQHYLGTKEREELALELDMTDDQVKTWFQNRRMKVKRKRAEDTQYYSKLAYMNSLASSLHPQYPGIHGYQPQMYQGYPSYPPAPQPSYHGYLAQYPSLRWSSPQSMYGAFPRPAFGHPSNTSPLPEYPGFCMSPPCRECPGSNCSCADLPSHQVSPPYVGFH